MIDELELLRAFHAPDANAQPDANTRADARSRLLTHVTQAQTGGPAHRRAIWRRGRFARIGRPAAGAFVVVAGAAVAVVIAVVAIAGLSGRTSRPAAIPQPSPADARAVAPLMRELAILRRPQTAADRTLPGSFAHASRFLRLIPAYTRLATTEDGARIYVVVRVPVQPAPHGVTVDALATAVVVAPNGRVQLADVARSGSDRLRGILFLHQVSNLDVSLVPDDVTRVKWVFAPSATGGVERRSVTVIPRITGNIAVAPAVPGIGIPQAVSWYGAHGRVIFQDNLAQDAAQAARRKRGATRRNRAAIRRSDSRTVAPSLLAHFSVFRHPQETYPALNPVPQLPLGIAAQLANQNGGMNLRYTRFVPLPGTEPPAKGYPHGIWLVPGGSALCFQDTQLAGGCATHLGTGRGSPLDGGDVTTNRSGSEHWIEGVVPDGNRTVTITLTNGRSIIVPVLDNAYAVALTTAPATLTDRNSAGKRVSFPL